MTETAPRLTMNGKPVFSVPAKSVINMESGFSHKLLCDGPTFSTGTACAYSCGFCYVPSIMEKSPHFAEAKAAGMAFEDVAIRRHGAIEAMSNQLTGIYRGKNRDILQKKLVIYASPLVDVAANMDLVRETTEACELIIANTNWDIRLLSKSNLLPKIAQMIPEARERIIFGVSTGTLDNALAASFEQGTPKVTKRIESLHWLQDNGFRTFGMICPSLPQRDYARFALDMVLSIRAELCEHVWAEVINVRGESMKRTCAGLRAGGFDWEASELERVAHDKDAWEEYSRATFEAHANLYAPGKLRFLQYVNASNKPYWQANVSRGAVLL